MQISALVLQPRQTTEGQAVSVQQLMSLVYNVYFM